MKDGRNHRWNRGEGRKLKRRNLLRMMLVAIVRDLARPRMVAAANLFLKAKSQNGDRDTRAQRSNTKANP